MSIHMFTGPAKNRNCEVCRKPIDGAYFELIDPLHGIFRIVTLCVKCYDRRCEQQDNVPKEAEAEITPPGT